MQFLKKYLFVNALKRIIMENQMKVWITYELQNHPEVKDARSLKSRRVFLFELLFNKWMKSTIPVS